MSRSGKVISLKERKHAKKYKWIHKMFNNFIAMFRVKLRAKTKNSSYKKKIIG